MCAMRAITGFQTIKYRIKSKICPQDGECKFQKLEAVGKTTFAEQYGPDDETQQTRSANKSNHQKKKKLPDNRVREQPTKDETKQRINPRSFEN
jgi:hypothetical protein